MNAAAHDDTGVDLDPLDPGEVHGLWIGERLSILAELCIRSFLYHGFRFKLFTYGPVENVPDGVAILDAGMILPANEAFVHKTGSLAPAADWFRYRFLHRNGGVWVDMDLICLKPFRIQRVPWFARENGSTVAIGLLAFPPGHELLREMERLAADPAAVMPWDTDEQARVKAELMRSMPGVAERRMAVDWGSAGPGEFTRALGHFGLLGHAAAHSSVYPVHYGVWRHLYDGTLRLDSPAFEQSFAIHLWGELTRREPDALANLAADSVVAGLMEQHGISLARLPSASPPEAGSGQRILVGVCSARSNAERRQAVRETWMSRPAENIEVVFFVGQGEHPLEDTGDIVVVQARDDYDHLPEKVQEFFRVALDRDFDWLFKCDDDTYVDLSRLHELAFRDYDLVGNEFIESRGAPSGGAGYFLTRRLAALLAADQRLPKTGAEDLIVGDAARVMGASLKGTRRLCWNTARFPQAENDVVTSHWCSPQRLRVIHGIRHSEASEVEAVHRHWRDRIKLFPSGSFTRCSTECSGTWTAVADGVIRLKWFSWPEESLVPEPASDTDSRNIPRYRCVRSTVESLAVELAGGLGNQMFQYAHGLALAREMGVELKLVFADYGRPFGLHHFGLTLDPAPHGKPEVIRHDGDFDETAEWPTLVRLRSTTASSVKIAGYFQNEGYFRRVAAEVRERFKIAPLDDYLKPNGIAVCIHIRRGDFVRSGLHDLCRPQYYLDAILLMRALVADPYFIVVSDDPAWCRETLADVPGTRVIGPVDELTTLRIMCSCEAFILSNSTFGWWGAWLSDARPVIAPSRFLAGRPWNICPDHWIQLPAEGAGGSRQARPRGPMFLIYGSPRSGTTRLCHELDARVPQGFRVFNEPFHPYPAAREAYGSDCADPAPEKAGRWLEERSGIAGIKLVANRTDSVIANRFHEMFARVVIINRDPIDIAISLEAATLTGQWNRGDGISRESNPPRVRVSLATMEKVREFLGNIETFRELRRASGLGGIKEITYDGVTEVGEAAAFLELPETRLRPPFREIRKMRTTESREERCSNLDEVVKFFRS